MIAFENVSTHLDTFPDHSRRIRTPLGGIEPLCRTARQVARVIFWVGSKLYHNKLLVVSLLILLKLNNELNSIKLYYRKLISYN